MPTDTVYGIVSCANDAQAVARLYRTKHREHKPGTIIAATVKQLVQLGVSEDALQTVAHLWPNSLSVIVPVGQNLMYLTQDLPDLAVRVPKDATIRTFLEQTGPLVTSSANQPGEPGANTVHEAYAYFGNAVDFYVDGGDLSGRAPSTIIRVTDNGIQVLRTGAVTIS